MTAGGPDDLPDLPDLEAVTLRRLIGMGEVSPVDLLEGCIARIEAVNPVINAVVTTCFERARAEAEEAGQQVQVGADLGPLHGLPLLVKDLADTAGLRTTYGSRCFAEHVPKEDAAVVARLRKAGAIVIGKTNTPEFGAGANTVNAVFGATRNPFDTDLTAGGSSGGSTAALATGMAPLATGSDLGGSLRIPAAFCSVVGMRPSTGRVPSESHVLGFSPLWTDGPLARTTADLALGFQGMTGVDRCDPLSLPPDARLSVDLEPAIDLKDLTVGFSTDLGMAPIDDDIASVFAERRTLIAGLVGSSVEATLDLGEADRCFRVLRAESFHASFAELVAKEGDRVGDNVRANVAEAERLTLPEVAEAGRVQTALFRKFQTLFDEIDVLICPATAVTPFPVERNYPGEINGRPLESYYAWYTITWVLSLMACPVVTLPAGRDHRGMPFGVQIVTARHQDGLALRTAAALEPALSARDLGRISLAIDRLMPGAQGSGRPEGSHQ